MSNSILWHDYETWGVNPKYDFPVQFAAIRTDLAFQQIGKDINFHCQIPNDYLPHPEACLVTGITPQQSLRDGYLEHEFAAKVHEHMIQAGTCVAGYNSIKFDDEVSRFLFYRNFYPVYEREYLNGNSRWDIIDLVRATYALRPDGIEWPLYETGLPCFKLETLCKANALEHHHAHDALSDVRATIALAKLIQQKQPKLYAYYWGLRDKYAVAKVIDVAQQKPFVHVSAYIPSMQGCVTWMMPVCMHPANKNAVLAVDLSKDISVLHDYSAEQLQSAELLEELFAARSVPVTQIAINKVPFVAPAKMLDENNAGRLGIDREGCLERYQSLRNMQGLKEKCQSMFINNRNDDTSLDIDAKLYTREFPKAVDIQWMKRIKEASPESLCTLYEATENVLYQKQLFRYIGRNFPSVMTQSELERWQAHRTQRFIQGTDPHYLSIEAFNQKVAHLLDVNSHDVKQTKVLRELAYYANEL